MHQNNPFLKIFQLRVAKSVLGITVKEIGKCLGVSGTIVSRWEQGNNFDQVKTFDKNILFLKDYFLRQELFFPDDKSISIHTTVSEKNSKDQNLTRFQLRAARVALDLSQARLSRVTKISESVIARAEYLDNNDYIRPANKSLSPRLKEWLQEQGIIFLNDSTIILNKK